LVTAVHIVLGVAVIAANLLAGIWGAVAWLRKVPSVVFWYLLRAAQAIVIVQVTVGFALSFAGEEVDQLHLIYGVGPVLVALFAEAIRAGAVNRELAEVADLEALTEAEQFEIAHRVARREIGVMAVSALLVVTLALRAHFGAS